MHFLAITGTALRVVQQLRRDPRTLALLIIVPVGLVWIMKLVFADQPGVFQRVGVPLVGVFPLTSMFLVTSITMLRERSSGTLERLMTMPLAKLDILLGYALAFGVVALVQAGLTALVAIGALGLDVEGPVAAVVALALLNALLGMALGLLVSAFATTEFQAVQFMPAFLLPQLLLCGLIAPRSQMNRALEIVSDVLPMTYAYDALARVASDDMGRQLAADIVILVAFMAGALVLGAATLRRRTA
ncbi:MAG: ABC transporter permease [Dehalococcoidia bacterium]|nr:ABC transporter permease [Dehalococcoidia bacterium]MCB9485229.1 ABC transporter permease [Thermoflexaceae bacterium]